MNDEQDRQSKQARIERLMDLERRLIPEKRLLSLPIPEWKALSLLVSLLDASSKCRVSGRGVITANYDHEVEIQVDLVGTISRPHQQNALGERHRRERHLFCRAVSSASGITIKQDACIIINGQFKADTPQLDTCVSFVLWAESGFPELPKTLADAILCARDPSVLEDREKMQEMAILRARQRLMREQEALERSLRISEAREDEEIRISNMGWRQLIAEHDSDMVDDSLSSVLACEIRNRELRYGTGLGEIPAMTGAGRSPDSRVHILSNADDN